MQTKPIPRMRTNRNDINRIFGMYAGLQELDEARQEMEGRFRSIPNGWRNLKMVISVLDKLLSDIMMTVPPEKLSSMSRMLPRMRFRVSCGVQASELDSEECIIAQRDADVLCTFAHEHCMMCLDGDCNRCPLGKTLDSIMTYDRDGQSWSMVSLSSVREGYDEEDKAHDKPV